MTNFVGIKNFRTFVARIKKSYDMKGKALFILLAAAIAASCSNKKESQNNDPVDDVKAQTNTVDLRGQWYLEK